MPFQFRQQEIVLLFESDEGLVQRLAAQEAAPDAELSFNPLFYREPNLAVLQSPTNSTMVQVRAGNATLVTRYFGEFSDPSQNNRRRDYSLNKLRYLLNLLESCGARMLFFGTISVTRRSIKDPQEQERIRKFLGEEFHLSRFAPDGPPLDFSFRIGRIRDEVRYSNVQLDWFEERTFVLPIDPATGAPQRRTTREWEIPVTDQGLEFRYDQNNKLALKSGRRAWSGAEFCGLATAYFDDVPGAVQSMEDLVQGALK